MESLLSQVRCTITEFGLLTPGETVVVGVSGGPDSLCLLHCLRRLESELDLSLQAAHLHHGLRGADADADAEFVRALAAGWEIPCVVERLDVPGLASEYGLAFEEAARRARYSFLSHVAESTGARTIAVGHNADDQAETVLMHFVRGSGLAGLRGMLPRTPLANYRLFEEGPGDAGDESPAIQPPATHLQLVRPLLEVTRADIEDYCRRHGLEPRFDRSNLDTTYFRNWLRHEVLPLLAEHNPNVREVIRRSARVIAGDYALLRSLLDEEWSRVVLAEELPEGPVVEGGQAGRIVFDLAAWRALPLALQRATLREAIHRLRRSLRNINFVHVEDAVRVAREGTTGDQATLPQGLALVVGYERLTVAGADEGEPLPGWPLLPAGSEGIAVTVPGVTALPDSPWVLEAKVMGRAGLPPGWQANDDPWLAYLDAAAAGGALVLRTRRTGDRFRPQGMGGHTVKLADFFTNQKVPRAARDRLPLLVARDAGMGAGQIVWVCGWRVDERVLVVPETERVLVLRFRPVA